MLRNEEAKTKTGEEKIIAEYFMKNKIRSLKQKYKFIVKNAEEQDCDEVDREELISDFKSLVHEGPKENCNHEEMKKYNKDMLCCKLQDLPNANIEKLVDLLFVTY